VLHPKRRFVLESHVSRARQGGFRLRECFALLSIHSAQDDKINIYSALRTDSFCTILDGRESLP
jgi:hypothetical protein